MRKRTFTTAERVLVHLSSGGLQPAEQTQEGIAGVTQSGRSTLTKWLDRLERRGLVSRDRIRLPGHPLPKYAYRLTEAGWQAAATLRQRLGAELVTVRAPKLGALSVRLSEVPTLAASRLDLTGAVAAVRKGRLNLLREAASARSEGSLIWGNGLHRVDRFYGRSQELRDLSNWWSSDSRALIVTGLAGIGKSALVAAWAQGRRLGAPVYGVETHPSSTAAGFLTDFAAFLAALDKPALATHLAQGVPLDPGFVSRLLERDLGGKRVLVIIDNADQAARDLARLLRNLFLQGGPKSRVKFLLVGRRLPRWAASEQRQPALEVRRIHGLDSAASKALLRSHGLAPDTPSAEEIARETRGHPLLLHLAAAMGAGEAAAVQRYLETEVWGTLPAKERSILESASVFRKAVSEHVLERVAGTDHRALESLVDRNLLERTIAGGYLMHDLVREAVASRLSEIRLLKLHARAANVLVGGNDSRERWEGIYHLLAAKQFSEAAALLDSEGARLLDSVAAEDIVSLVHAFTLDETEAAIYCVFAEILGDSLRIRGHIEPALFQYAHAQRLAERAGQVNRVPRLLRKLANLERTRNRYAKALGYLVEARARLEESRDRVEMAEVLRELALTQQGMGELNEAAEHLNEAIDLATESFDQANLSRTLLALGTLETQRGHLTQGLDLDFEGLRIAEHSGNLTETTHAQVVIGAALITMARPSESIRHLDEGFETARLLGNLRLMAYATLNRTSALLQLGRYKEAASSLRQAKDFFDILEEKDTAGFLKTYEGEVEMGLGHWARASGAWREGIAELRKHGSPAELALVLWDVAEFTARHGDAEESQAYLIEAREIARMVGNRDLLSRIDSRLGIARAGTLPHGRL